MRSLTCIVVLFFSVVSVVIAAPLRHKLCRDKFAAASLANDHTFTPVTNAGPGAFAAFNQGAPPVTTVPGAAENQNNCPMQYVNGGTDVTANLHFYTGARVNADPKCLFLSIDHKKGGCYQVYDLAPYKKDPANCFRVTIQDVSVCEADRKLQCEQIFDQKLTSGSCRKKLQDARVCKIAGNVNSAACFTALQTQLATPAINAGAAAATSHPWYERRLNDYIIPQINQDFHRRRRIGANAMFLIDGDSYFQQLAADIQTAQHTIYIAGWGINAFTQLINRPYNAGTCPTTHAGVRDCTLLGVLWAQAVAQVNLKIRVILFSPKIDMLNTFAVTAHDKLMRLNTIRAGTVDVTLHPSRGNGNSVLLYSHHGKFVVIDNNIAFVGGIDIMRTRADTQDHAIPANPPHGLPLVPSFVPTAAYTNTFRHDRHEKDNADITVPGISWHDVACRVNDANINADLKRLFLMRWVGVNTQSYGGINSYLLNPATSLRNGREQIAGYMTAPHNSPHSILQANTLHATLLFSLTYWSGLPSRLQGTSYTNEVDHSIWDQWKRLIREAQNFIYIEQQYFISRGCELYGNDVLQGGPTVDCLNDLSIVLMDRVVDAALNNGDLRVVVLLPYLGDANQVAFMKRTVNAFLRAIKYRIGTRNPDDYILFVAPRNFALYPAVAPHTHVLTTAIYVHDKVIVTDKSAAIIGSANINDRSMTGDRDSEVALLFEATGTDRSLFDFLAQMLREHLGERGAPYNGFWNTVPANAIQWQAIFTKVRNTMNANQACTTALINSIGGATFIPAKVLGVNTLTDASENLQIFAYHLNCDAANVANPLRANLRGRLVRWPHVTLGAGGAPTYVDEVLADDKEKGYDGPTSGANYYITRDLRFKQLRELTKQQGGGEDDFDTTEDWEKTYGTLSEDAFVLSSYGITPEILEVDKLRKHSPKFVDVLNPKFINDTATEEEAKKPKCAETDDCFNIVQKSMTIINKYIVDKLDYSAFQQQTATIREIIEEDCAEHSPNCVLVFSDFLNTEGTKYQIASDEVYAKKLQEQQANKRKTTTPSGKDLSPTGEPLTDAQRAQKEAAERAAKGDRDTPKIGTHRT